MPEENPIETLWDDWEDFLDNRKESYLCAVINHDDYQRVIQSIDSIEEKLTSFASLIPDETKAKEFREILMNLSDEYAHLESITSSCIFRGGITEGARLMALLLPPAQMPTGR